MYENVVKDLRHCVENPDRRGCAEGCTIGKEHPLNYWCIPALMTAAADAIEELRRSEAVALEYGADEHNKRLALEQRYRWIPVEERLPEAKIGHVLVYEDGDIMMASYSDGEWYLRDMYEIVELKPTHWMPLPEPPKEE